MKRAIVFDVEWVVLSSSRELIPDTFEFIKANFEEYLFFTNTSLPRSSLLQIFSDLNMKKYFDELLAYDDGSKKENIEYVMQVYKLEPKNILFIDDKQSHINNVSWTWVRTLLFHQDGVPLQEKIKNIFW